MKVYMEPVSSSLYLIVYMFYIWSFCSHSVLGCLCPQLLALTAQDLLSLVSIIANHLRAVKINDVQ